ncbi:hypothetical protein, partial [Geomicrobium sp. JCM 19037]|uniref:hypothetical protein n=1 Tax=Geomicrobium sp. JCM 19037 TaxID=1460634 RepID=UPI001EE67EB2
ICAVAVLATLLIYHNQRFASITFLKSFLGANCCSQAQDISYHLSTLTVNNFFSVVITVVVADL